MKGKKRLWILLALFVLPVVAAKLVLENGWYNGGVTNKGKLLEAGIAAGWLDHSGQWRLIYTMPQECGDGCKSALFQLEQIPVAVGRERDRVASILLTGNAQTKPSLDSLVTVQPASAGQIAEFENLPYGADAIYLVDPLDNLILAYPVDAAFAKDGPEELASGDLAPGKGLLSDLKKLMKLSKVG